MLDNFMGMGCMHKISKVTDVQNVPAKRRLKQLTVGAWGNEMRAGLVKPTAAPFVECFCLVYRGVQRAAYKSS
jgi:hypothetical protein